ncbi:MAG: hypothetical protein LW817_04595 [Candidatus Caenarcaniphilales bacterium]|jgi:hypothetical protein|nr:hypothetical protein [Candidatus Caenarcaniphilales bacterium]
MIGTLLAAATAPIASYVLNQKSVQQSAAAMERRFVEALFKQIEENAPIQRISRDSNEMQSLHQAA